MFKSYNKNIVIVFAALLLFGLYFLSCLARFSNIFFNIDSNLEKIITVFTGISVIILLGFIFKLINLNKFYSKITIKTQILIIFIIGFMSYSSFVFSPLCTCDDLKLMVHLPSLSSFFDCFKFHHITEGGYRPWNNVKAYFIFNFLNLNRNWGYFILQVLSIFKHILSAVFLLLISNRIFKSKNAGFYSAIIFVSLFSVMESFTIWIDGVRDATFYSLFSVYLLFLFYERVKNTYYVFALISFLIALLSKENSIFITIPILSIILMHKDKILKNSTLYILVSTFFLIIHYVFRNYFSKIFINDNDTEYSWNIITNIYKNIEWIMLKQWIFNPNILLALILIISIFLVLSKVKKSSILFIFLWIIFSVWPTNFWPSGIHPHYNVERYAYIIAPGIALILGISFNSLVNIKFKLLKTNNLIAAILLTSFIASSFIIYHNNQKWISSGRLLNKIVFESELIYTEEIKDKKLDIYLHDDEYYVALWKGPLTTYYSKNSDYKIITNNLRSNQLNTLDTNKINILKQNRFLISSTNILK